MNAEVTNFKESCHAGHDSVSDLRQSDIGWLAPLVAVAGLLLAIAGARGWGESPSADEFRQEVSPATESYSHGVLGHDAGPPDALIRDDTILVGQALLRDCRGNRFASRLRAGHEESPVGLAVMNH